MRVIIDGTPLATGNKGGVGYYCQYLIDGLVSSDKENEYVALYNKSKLERFPRVTAKEKYLSYPYRNFWKIFGSNFLYNIPLECFTGKFEIFHGTDTRLLPVHNARTVVTIHDVEYASSPATVPKKDIHLRSKLFPYSARGATRIIAVSEHTKKDIVNHLGIDPQKIQVTHLAADKIYKVIDNEEKLASVRKKYKLPSKFILYVGGLYPRKNIPNMLKAYAIVKKRTGCQQKFVLVGMKAEAMQEISITIKQLGLINDVIFPGYIDIEDMPVIYNLADVFMHVSIFEGFGLPPLEAMQCGTPVLVSNVASLPEVVGDAGFQVNPFDIEEMSLKLEKLIISEERINYYKKKGLERAALFSWEKTVQLTLDVYKSCMEI